VTSPTVDVEPACPGSDPAGNSAPTGPAGRRAPAVAATPNRTLRAERRDFDALDAATWDALAARTPWATPFSRWAAHRAWWDAYGANAHDQTLVVIDPDAPAGSPPVAIVPLMHRHEVEATDLITHTRMRADSDEPLTPVAPHAKAVFFGASYHADYATVLTAPADLSVVAEAVVAHLAAPPDATDEHPEPWDVVDLRRLRCGDPTADILAQAFGAREIAEGWTLNVEREDVCPVLALPIGGDIEMYLATLGKKERHEIRRKARRAEAAGEVRLEESPDALTDLGSFIDLHQRRWGADGLFADTPGGAQSRVFFRRLFELFGPDDVLRLSFLTVGGRRIAAGIHLDDGDAFYYYNAGVDPEARELSPGVLMIARYIERAIALGRRRFDFLRGDEPYKYEWGAVDEPIQRLLVRRTGS
jgi:CelD/BcsL family acetyltransferase involved in cellulose biosynthesis